MLNTLSLVTEVLPRRTLPKEMMNEEETDLFKLSCTLVFPECSGIGFVHKKLYYLYSENV